VNAVIIIVGITVLIGLAVLVGVSMDTEAQRVVWREIAYERRKRREELAALQQERERLRQERRRLKQELGTMRSQAPALCDDCPLRRFRS
jgi:uncharacterized protein (DUF3084 family)